LSRISAETVPVYVYMTERGDGAAGWSENPLDAAIEREFGLRPGMMDQITRDGIARRAAEKQQEQSQIEGDQVDVYGSSASQASGPGASLES